MLYDHVTMVFVPRRSDQALTEPHAVGNTPIASVRSRSTLPLGFMKCTGAQAWPFGDAVVSGHLGLFSKPLPDG